MREKIESLFLVSDTYGSGPYCRERDVHKLESDFEKLENFTDGVKDVIADLEQQVSDTETALTGAITCIESMKCCGNCDHYRTIPVKYHLEEYCNIIEDPQERRDIAKYDTKCTNWKSKESS